MVDVLTALLWAASLRKAAALEQWLRKHQHCDPKPATEFPTDNMTSVTNCSCGESVTITVIPTLTITTSNAKDTIRTA